VPLREGVPAAGPRAEAAGLSQAAQQAAVAVARPSVAAPVPAPAVARQVLPGLSGRQAQGLLLAARHEAQPVAAAAEPTGAGVVAEAAVAAEPDVAEAAAFPVVPAGLPSVLPWAAAWVFHQDRVLPWPVRRRSAPTARAMEWSPVAWRSERSWPAALVVVFSCALGPGEI